MKYSIIAFLGDFWCYIKPYQGRFWFASILRLVSDLTSLYISFAMASIVSFVAHYKAGISLTPIYVILGLWFASVTVRSITLFYAKNIGNQIGERISLDAVIKSITQLFLIDIAWHEKENAGNKLKRIQRGSDGLERAVRMWFANSIEIAVNFVAITFILMRADKAVGIIVIIYVITFYLLATSFKRKIVQVTDLSNAQEEHMSGLLFESINNIRSVKVMSMSEKLLATIKNAGNVLYATIQRRIWLFQASSVARNYYTAVYRIGVTAYIIYEVVHGRYDIGFIVLFTGYFGNISESVRELSDVSQDFLVAKFGVARMQTIINQPVSIDLEEGKRRFPKDWKVIEVKDLSFSYHERLALEAVSFTIKRGEKIGVVGLSGAGKSTLFKLLLKEHENYAGAIYVDGISLKDISKKDYFNYLAVVLQDTELFNLSLKDNITLTNAREESNITLFRKALTVAHVEDFMSKLPHGVDSIVGEKGVRLSGGEKQRVGIARAVFKNPQILLLDEATSHLDVESEEKIQDSLHQFFQNVTAIVIAHRLTTIKEMDRIIVLEDGKVVESGSFRQLRRLKGRFNELWDKQKL